MKDIQELVEQWKSFKACQRAEAEALPEGVLQAGYLRTDFSLFMDYLEKSYPHL